MITYITKETLKKKKIWILKSKKEIKCNIKLYIFLKLIIYIVKYKK